MSVLVPTSYWPRKLRLGLRSASRTPQQCGLEALEQVQSLRSEADGLRRVAIKATVLVPSYRRPLDLERCLAALRHQTEPADEVLVVIWESDGDTLRFLRGVAAEEMRLRCLTAIEPGQVAALNRGLEEARGDIVAILDDDAAPHPEWLARVRCHFEADPTLGGVGGRDVIYRNGAVWQGRQRVVGRVQWFGRVHRQPSPWFGGPRYVDTLKGANMSFRRQAIEGLRFDPRLRAQGVQMHNCVHGLGGCRGHERATRRGAIREARAPSQGSQSGGSHGRVPAGPMGGMADVAAEQAFTFRLAGPSGFSAKDLLAWGVAVGFAAFVAGLLAHGSGHIVELTFPALALLVGATLYFQHPTLYLGFTWWLWFLTPEVRRIVDYQTGWSDISPVMIAPYLVAGVAALTLVRGLPQLLQRTAFFPFALVLMGLNYGYTIGLVRAGPLAATYGLLTWVVPVVFGFHVAVHWQQYPLYRDAIQRVFLWGVLAMGIYGIVQFFVLPTWDAYWMRASPINSVGGPHPFRVRVWSTMNSPQPFAHAMMAGLLIAFAAKGPFRFIAGVPGSVSFLLSLVRTAWLGWVVGVAFLLMRVGGVRKIRLLVVGMLLGLLSLPLLLLEPVADRVTDRFETMHDIEEDSSFRSRLALYGSFILASSTNIVGQGIGSASRATKLGNDRDLAKFRTIDAGVLEVMFVLGWPGTLLYVGGLGWLLRAVLSGRAHRRDLMVQAAGAIVLASLAMTTSYNTLIGVGGMVFWSFLGLMLSARMFHSQERQPKAVKQGSVG